VDRDWELVFDQVDVNRVLTAHAAEVEDAAVGQELLVAKARFEPLTHGLGARQQEDHQVVGTRMPGVGGAEPEVTVSARRQRGTPEPAKRIAWGTAGRISEDVEIMPDLSAKGLDVEA